MSAGFLLITDGGAALNGTRIAGTGIGVTLSAVGLIAAHAARCHTASLQWMGVSSNS
jgi:hypothetical protein